MGKKTESNNLQQDDWLDGDPEAVVDQVDIDELVETVHNAKEYHSSFAKPRSARRRLDDLAFERTLKDELFDWYDDFGGGDTSNGQDAY